MPFLVDANVLSEATKPQPSERVARWMRDHEEDLMVDPIVLGEIQTGILLLPKGRRREHLEHWFSKVVEAIYCLPWDADTALRWAKLLAQLRAAGQSMPLKDSLIAASALTYGLTVATSNEADFRTSGVTIFNPFKM